ncbi:MAG: hypothetical protein PHS49_02470 [Candidatus Gracilibacteria bacterium]|nr:hypothetical protein [Candidatus Gracilibacteria bacterium]
MGKVIDISTGNTIITNQEQQLNELIAKGLEITPELVKDILGTGIRDIVQVGTNEFKQLILDYIIFKLRNGKVEITKGINMGINYLSELLFKFLYIKEDDELKQIISNPYFIHWAGLGEYKKAGDASVYKYIFWEPNRKEMMSRKAYIDFAMAGYMNYFGDEEFANSVGILLPVVGSISKEKDFFRRDFGVVR